MKHTEGKLHIERQHDAPCYEIWHGKLGDKNRRLIAEYVNEANAQRIVDCWNGCVNIKNPLAMGELLEACKETLDITNSYSHIPAQFEACQILQQAINKAERS